MKTIWKFPLEVADEQRVEIPVGARLLSVGEQNGKLMLWALVDLEADRESRSVAVRGTGDPADGLEHAAYIGAVLAVGGRLVWHVFVW